MPGEGGFASLIKLKVNTTFSSWIELIQEGRGWWNFVDDARAYVCDVNLESVLGKLEKNSELTLTCFGKKLYETEHW